MSPDGDWAATGIPLQAIVDSAPIALVVCDLGGCVTFARGQALERFGLDPAQLVGRHVVDLFPERDDIHERMRRALDGEDVHIRSFFAADFTDTWYRAVRDDSGRIVGAMSVVTVVTDQVKLQQRTLALAEIAQLAADGTPLDDVLDLVVKTASAHLAPLAALALFDKSGALVHRAVHHPDSDHAALERARRATFPLRVDPAAVADRLADPRFPLAARLDAPIKVGGEVVGVLFTARHDPAAHFDGDDVAFGTALADRVATAVEHVRLAEAREAREAQQAAVAVLGQEALTSTFAELLPRATELITGAIGERAIVVLGDGEDGDLVIRAVSGLPERLLGTGGARRDPDTPTGYVLASPEPVVSDDIYADPRFQPPRERLGVVFDQSMAACRIDTRHGPIGVTFVTAPGTSRYTASDLGFVAAITGILGHTYDHEVATEEIRHNAFHDGLTGLPNRALLEDRLAAALARARSGGEQVALVACALDHLKLVTDSHGHRAGDAFVCAVAERLVGAVGADGTVARFAGDEFVVLLPVVDHEADVVQLAARIVAAMDAPIDLGDGEHLAASVSMGVALSGTSGTVDRLVHQAGAALSRAKDHGTGRWELFDDELHARARRRLTVETELRRAVAAGDLVLHFQPIVDLRSRCVLGVEALVRWQHPSRGLLGPHEFIPVAEESGLVRDLGEWVLADACRQTAEWCGLGLWDERSTSLNLAAAQLDASLPSRVAAATSAARVDPGRIRVELTETTLLRDTSAAEAVLSRLREMGVRASIDDFGTGYSSLAYLAALSVDTLKIDRAFVSRLVDHQPSAAITAAVTELAHALGMVAVAEGVETDAQAERLARLGCDAMQGFLISRPVPADAIVAMLTDGSACRG